MAITATTAILGAAAIGAGTSIIAGNKAASAAKSAAALQAGQGAQIRSDLGPFREIGTAAAFELAALQGLPVNFPGSQADGPVIDEAGNPVSGGFRTNPAEEPTAIAPIRRRFRG